MERELLMLVSNEGEGRGREESDSAVRFDSVAARAGDGIRDGCADEENDGERLRPARVGPISKEPRPFDSDIGALGWSLSDCSEGAGMLTSNWGTPSRLGLGGGASKRFERDEPSCAVFASIGASLIRVTFCDRCSDPYLSEPFRCGKPYIWEVPSLCDGVRDGGVIGWGDGRSVFPKRFEPARDSGLTVDEEEDDVPDSRTAVSPVLRGTVCSSCCIKRSANLFLVTGGRLLVGLVVLARKGALMGVGTPGDWDDIEVGVDVRLNAPGDSERRVEEPLSGA